MSSGAEITSSNDDASYAKSNRKMLLADTGTNIEAATKQGSGQMAFSTNTLNNGRKEKGTYYSVDNDSLTWTRLYDQVAFPMIWGSFQPASSTFAQNLDGYLQIASSSGTVALQSIDATHGRCVRFTTGASTGNTSGFNLGQQFTARQWNPAFHFKVRLQETTNNRAFFGFTTGTGILGNTDDPLNAAGGVIVGKRVGDTNWFVGHNDGVGATVWDDSGIAVGTGFCMINIYGDDGAGAWYASVETSVTEASVTLTTDIPSSTSNNSVQLTYITNTALARSFEIFEGLITSQR